MEDLRYTSDEINEAITALSVSEVVRITDIARYFSKRSGMPAEDLRQEAFVRALGTRTCRVGTGMVEFLAGIIKSIASEEPRARKHARKTGGFDLSYVSDYGERGVPDPASDRPSPEDEALSRIYHAEELRKAMACIDDDFELQLLAEGLFDGKRGKELEDLLGKDAKGLAAARKKLSRRLQAGFPCGVPV